MKIQTKHLYTYAGIWALASIWLFFRLNTLPAQLEILCVALVPLTIALICLNRAICNPYIYLLPCSAIIGVNLYVSQTKNPDETLFYAYILSIALLSFHAGLYLPNKENKTLEDPTTQLAMIVFIVSFFLILSIHALPGLTAKALHFSLTPFTTALLWGSILALARRNILFALIAYISYSSFLTYKSLTAVDISRFSFLEIVFLAWLVAKARTSIKINKLDFILAIAAMTAVVSIDIQSLGGDALIVLSATNSFIALDTHEPFMPFFNGFFILIPDDLWFTPKPKAYNPSAWYLSKVLNVDPNEYPWGIGLSMPAASYIYGGILGVTLSFFALGIVTGKYLSKPRCLFELGFYSSFLFKLPFGMFRMDETFIFGAWIITFILLAVSRPIFSQAFGVIDKQRM